MIQRIKYSEGKPKVISIEILPSSRASRIVLQVFMIIFFAIPIVSTIVLAIFSALHPAIIISYIIFGFSGRFFLKLFLWNKYGKEYLTLEADKILYEADYKMFKGNKAEVNIGGFQVGIHKLKNDFEGLGVMTIANELESIDTVVKIPINELEVLKERIENNYE